jgi:DNA (cytosine-5)-methyltransferase 1
MLTTAHLFSGGGGDTEGAIAANYNPLWAIEYDKTASAIYRKRFPIVQLIESDVTSLSDEFICSLPVPDVLVWGSPCPDFSMAGTRAGFDGTRGSLFFEGVRFLRLQKPKSFVFENVDGLLSHDKGQTFQKVISAFGQLGYMGTWQVRNGNRHVPQSRVRVFCMGLYRGHSSHATQATQEDFAAVPS